MKIKAWAIEKAKEIICKECMTCAELEGICKTLRARNDELIAEKNRIQDDDENMIYHWMEQYQDATVKMEKAQDRCVGLQNTIERLCQGYDAMAMAVEGLKHGKE